MDKLRELFEELKLVLLGKGNRILDSIVPLLVFLGVYALFDLNLAAGASLLAAAGFLGYRLYRRESPAYALGGFASVLLAVLLVYFNNSEAGFFLPGMISGAVTVALCLLSVLVRRPLAAWSSALTRRWPLDWYWHPRVLPAYQQVTLFWAFAFAARLGAQYWFYRRGDIGALGTIEILLGWPYIVFILVVSYLYGIWRLGDLGGPSVEEFKNGAPPPWQGQKRGF